MGEWAAGILAGLFLLYVAVRFISVAWYQSKLDYEKRKKQNDR